MFRAMQATAVWIVFSFTPALGAEQIDAAASSVGVSIHFEIAPIDLFRTRNAEPAKVRSCKSLKTRVDATWSGKPRGPILRCSSLANMPLIATEESGSDLIVRP